MTNVFLVDGEECRGFLWIGCWKGFEDGQDFFLQVGLQLSSPKLVEGIQGKTFDGVWIVDISPVLLQETLVLLVGQQALSNGLMVDCLESVQFLLTWTVLSDQADP
jgi:hypothetical protein